MNCWSLGKTLSESTKQAISHRSDAVIVSSKVTGEGPALEDLREAREAAGDFPVLVGSGTSPQNVRELFQYADGAIVGTSLKNSMAFHERVVPDRVKQLMNAVRKNFPGLK